MSTKAAILRDGYDERNLSLAREVQREPDKYPHLVDWARLVVARLAPKETK